MSESDFSRLPVCWRAIAWTACCSAGCSRNCPARLSEFNNDRTSRSRASSPPQADFRNAWHSSGSWSRAAWNTSSTLFQRSVFMRIVATELAVNPRFGRSPVALDGDGRYLQHLSRLLHTNPAKKTHLDNPHFARVELRQSLHCVIQRNQSGA